MPTRKVGPSRSHEPAAARGPLPPTERQDEMLEGLQRRMPTNKAPDARTPHQQSVVCVRLPVRHAITEPVGPAVREAHSVSLGYEAAAFTDGLGLRMHPTIAECGVNVAEAVSPRDPQPQVVIH